MREQPLPTYVHYPGLTKASCRACLVEPSVERIVGTSSLAACLFGHDQEDDPSPLTESDWNEVSSLEDKDAMQW